MNYLEPKDLTQENRQNLAKLSTELKHWHFELNSPNFNHDLIGFDMGYWMTSRGGYCLSLSPSEALIRYGKRSEIYLDSQCGTSCCAVGFAVLVGIGNPRNWRSFSAYSVNTFGYGLHDYLFSSNWRTERDSPLNVALRIDAFLSGDFKLFEYEEWDLLTARWSNYISPLLDKIEADLAETYGV